MRVKAIFQLNAGMREDFAKLALQADQPLDVRTGDPRPEHLGAAKVGKGADVLDHKRESPFLRDHPAKLGFKQFDVRDRKMAKKMQRQMDPRHVITAQAVIERL